MGQTCVAPNFQGLLQKLSHLKDSKVSIALIEPPTIRSGRLFVIVICHDLKVFLP
jgi:hypothetical protein